MPVTSPLEVTGLLLAWRGGDDAALERLAPLVYEELRRLARCHMRGERPGHTLQATALANEAYLRLIDTRRIAWHDRAHFFAMASRLMRRVLVDAARAHRADKRGGNDIRVSLDRALGLAARGDDLDLVALDDALQELAKLDERKSKVVELRFFGGLSVEETAAVLEVSSDTVTRDWNFVKSWLRRELGGGAPAS
jgi:RNA polymerase sigma-70 factor (ECF subfamily)